MHNSRMIAAALVALASVPALASSRSASAWPAADQRHRAFFCALGGESLDQTMPPGYGTAMLKQLRTLEASGLSTAQAIDKLRTQARCGKQAHLPAPDSWWSS